MDTSAATYRVISSHLKESEHVKLAVSCRASEKSEEHLVLAIVASAADDVHDGEEEAAVFLFTILNLVPPVLRLTSVVPVARDVRMSLAQRELADGASEFVLHVLVPNRDEIVVIPNEISDVSDILKEFRRLCEASSQDSTTSEFPWLNPYINEISGVSSPPEAPVKPEYFKYLRTPAQSQPLPAIFAGYSADEEHGDDIIRDDFIRKTLRDAEPEYCEKQSLRIRINTFNVQSQPPKQDLSPWINGSSEIEMDGNTDVYVFGFQELDTSTEALLYASTTVKENMWFEAIVQAMGPKGSQYQKLVSKQLVGMLIIVLIRKSLHVHSSSISSSSVGVGILNTLGNKGAVGLRFRIHDTTFCFVNSHLAAFDEMVERRNSDYREIVRRMAFILPEVVGSQQDDMMSVWADVERDGAVSIFDSDCVFWMGDLNYRVDLPDDEIRILLTDAKDSSLPSIFTHDQLSNHQRTSGIFPNFQEQEITFRPTYKFLRPLSAPDATPPVYDSKRRPAWTDRILWTTKSPSAIVSPRLYRSHPDITLSDHIPVSAEFDVQVRSVDWKKLGEVVERTMKLLDASKVDDVTPRITLETTQLDIDELAYDVPKEISLILSNTGEVAASFRFIPQEVSQPTVPPWLSIEPESGYLLPGTSQRVVFRAHVESETAPLVNSLEASSIEQLVIMHTGFGKDHFISFKGNFVRTCFGISLPELARFPIPIQQATRETVLLEPENTMTAPKEVMRLIEWLMTNALTVDDLFVKRGDKESCRKIREMLDNGEDLPKLKLSPSGVDAARVAEEHLTKVNDLALAVGTVLLDLLASVPEPIVPPEMYGLCAAASNKEEAFEVIEALPSVCSNVMISVTAFLHYLVQAQASGSKRSLAALARVFAQVLLPDRARQRLTPVAKRSFLLHLIS